MDRIIACQFQRDAGYTPLFTGPLLDPILDSVPPYPNVFVQCQPHPLGGGRVGEEGRTLHSN